MRPISVGIFLVWLLAGVVFPVKVFAKSNKEDITTLLRQYEDERATLEMIYHELDQMRDPVEQVIRPLMKEYETRMERLTEERLKNHVLPKCKEQYRKHRLKAREMILSEKYNSHWENRGYRRKVRQKARELMRFFHHPLRWYLRRYTDLYSDFTRLRILRGYLEDIRETSPDGVSSSETVSIETKMERLLRMAKGIIRTDSVGRSRTLQPYYEKNKQVQKKNHNRTKFLSSKEQQVIELINQYREAFGLRRLVIHPDLVEAAKTHNQEMKKMDYFAHHSPVPDRRTVRERLKQVGFRSEVAGENIAYGRFSPEAILREWQFSPAHHKNLLKSNYHLIGAGKKGPFWTVVLSGRSRKQQYR